MEESTEDWFVRNVLCYEAALTRYLERAWPNRHDVTDLRHEIYVRMLEAAEKARPSSPRFFLFTVAKNLLADRARRNRIVSIDLLQDLDSLNVLIDDITPERHEGTRQQLLRLSGAFEELPERCREVVWMRKIEDLPQKEIARRLGIQESTVEQHLVRGMRMLTQLYYGSATGTGARKRRSRQESQHGQ